MLRAVTERTAAIIAEPIQGEGRHPADVARPSPQAINEVCRRTGTLFIADEVQTGLGRTGHPFYSQALGLAPDLISVGKALGSGVPVGAALVSERVAQAISPGDHGSTYGGNLLATRAAAFFLEQLMDHGLLEHVKTRRRALRAPAARARAAASGRSTEVRGAGLMCGLQLRIDATVVIDEARNRGLLVNRTDEKVVRMLPPLTIASGELDRAVDILDGVLASVATEVPA